MDKISINKITGKRINAFAQFTDEAGVRYPIAPSNLVEWVDAPQPPEDYSEETYYRTEQDEAPYVVFTKKSDEQIAQIQQAKVNAQSLAYLASTDWLITRAIETGKAEHRVPDEVLAARQAARDAIVKPTEQPL